MKLAKSFTLPEEDPVLPERLLDRVTDWLPSATKVDICVAVGRGWRLINTITLDGNEDPTELVTIVKAYADYHASERGENGKYRVCVWCTVDEGRTERHRYNFDVVLEEFDVRPTAEDDGANPAPGWRDLTESQAAFADRVTKFACDALDRLLHQSVAQGRHLEVMPEILHELVTPYRDGLRMQAAAVREVGEAHLRQRQAEAQSGEGSKFWEAFAPAIQVVAAHAQQRLVGGGKPRALPGKAAARGAPRSYVDAAASTPSGRSHAPPTTPPPAPPPSAAAAPEMPTTLHELAAAVLEQVPARALVQLTRQLDPDQAGFLEAIVDADNDDDSADAIVGLMESLATNMRAVGALTSLLGPEHLSALRQLAVLAKRIVDERGDESDEAAPPGSGSAASPGKDGLGKG